MIKKSYKKIFLVLIIGLIISTLFGRGEVRSFDPRSSSIEDKELGAADIFIISDKFCASVSKENWFKEAVRQKKIWLAIREMKNATDEHVNTTIFIDKIRSKLINKFKAIFLDYEVLVSILKEDGITEFDIIKPEIITKIRKKWKVDLLLKGELSNSRGFSEDRLSQKTDYIFSFQIIETETSKIKWSDQFIITKIFRRNNYR